MRRFASMAAGASLRRAASLMIAGTGMRRTATMIVAGLATMVAAVVATMIYAGLAAMIAVIATRFSLRVTFSKMLTPSFSRST
jgi:hypothetical protein